MSRPSLSTTTLPINQNTYKGGKMKQILILMVILTGFSLSAHPHNPDDDENCIAIYAADTAYFATAAQSEKLLTVSQVNSMRLERDGRFGTIYVEGSQGNTTFLLHISLVQDCSGKVIEVGEVIAH